MYTCGVLAVAFVYSVCSSPELTPRRLRVGMLAYIVQCTLVSPQSTAREREHKMATTNKLPAGIGKTLRDTDGCAGAYGVRANTYKVQTPDNMWSMMIARMKAQIDVRDKALHAWELAHGSDFGYIGYGPRAEEYWRAFYTEKAKHRVDYPMPWGHVIFASEGK